jgi:hypothetical protein
MGINIRFLFTYWVVLWTILYFIAVYGFESQYIKEHFNPLFVILCEAVITVLCSILYILHPRAKLNSGVIKWIGMNLITKGIPVYLLWNTPINYIQDSFNAIILFSIYYMYLLIHNTNLYKVYSSIYFSVLNKTYKPILLTLIE